MKSVGSRGTSIQTEESMWIHLQESDQSSEKDEEDDEEILVPHGQPVGRDITIALPP